MNKILFNEMRVQIGGIMKQFSRRQFTGGLAVGSAMLAMPSLASGARPKVVVVGGGAGGATAARYIAKDSDGAIDVTLVEASKHYYTCFFSNLYLGGFRDYSSIGHSYDGLSNNHGVNVVHDWALSVNNAKKVLKLASNTELPYDRLVLSPGIDLKYDSINGYSAEAQTRMPHAWRSGTQIQILSDQI